jgi:CRP/FNR family transcriptional regulator
MEYGLIKNYFSGCKKLKYRKGQVLIRAGVPCSGIFYIESGYVKLFSEDNEGNEQVILIFQSGDFFPLNNIFNKYMSHLNCQCLTDCEIKYSEKTSLENFLNGNQEAMKELFRYSGETIKSMTIRVQCVSLQKASTRLLFKLLFLVKRFGQIQGNTIVINSPLSQSDIANSISISRETANRMFEKLEKDNLIEYKSKTILIKDLEKLKEILSQLTDISWFE